MSVVAVIGNSAASVRNFRGPLLQAMVARGHRVVVLAPDWSPPEEVAVRALGVEVASYPLSRAGINPFQDVRTLLALRSTLKSIGPDVTLAYFIKPVIWGTLAAWSLSVPHRVAMIEGLGFAFTDDGQTPTLKRRLLRRVVVGLFGVALPHAHKVLLLNSDDQAELTALGLLVPGQAVNVGGIGVNLDDWPATPLPSGPLTFALAARMLREKGVLDFVAAARLIKHQHPSVRFLLLGGLDENPSALARSEVQQWVDEGVLEWPGHVPMLPWLAQCSIYVLPSYREGVPRSTQEAMALGRPVITEEKGGNVDEEKELALRKYAELYEHSKAVLAEELARSHRTDEKASKYLTALSLVLGALVFFFQQLVDKKLLPPQGMLDCLIFQAMIVLFGAALLAWWFVFSCLRNDKFVKPPLDQTTINFYDANELIDIYYAMAKGNMDALAQNKGVGDRKSQALYRGYWAMNVAVVAVAVLFLLLLVRHWNFPTP